MQKQLSQAAGSKASGQITAPSAAAEQVPQQADTSAVAEGGLSSALVPGQRTTESLLTLAAKARKGKPEESEQEKALKEEADLLRQTTQHKALQGVQEIARVRG